MNRFRTLRWILILLGMLWPAAPAIAQTSCPAGTSPTTWGQYRDNTTQNVVANFCVDSHGVVTSLNNGAAVTIVTSLPATCATGTQYFYNGISLTCASTNHLIAVGNAEVSALNFGAQFNSHSIKDATWTANQTPTSIITTSAAVGDVPFTASMVGQIVYGVCSGSDFNTGNLDVPVTTILSVNSATSITVNTAIGNVACSGQGLLIWGTDDTAALQAWAGAYPCDSGIAGGVLTNGNSQKFTMPAGGTIFHAQIFGPNQMPQCSGASTQGGAIEGQGINSTYLFPRPGFSTAGIPLFGLGGMFLDSTNSGLRPDTVGGFTMYSPNYNFQTDFVSLSGTFLNTPGNAHDIQIFGANGLQAGFASYSGNRAVLFNIASGTNGANLNEGGILINGAQGPVTLLGGYASNSTTPDVVVNNSCQNTAIPCQVTIQGFLKDEDGTQGCFHVTSSLNVVFSQVTSYCALVVSASTVFIQHSSITDFNNDSTNFTSVTIDATSKVGLQDVILKGKGTGFGINNTAGGVCNDFGGISMLAGTEVTGTACVKLTAVVPPATTVTTGAQSGSLSSTPLLTKNGFVNFSASVTVTAGTATSITMQICGVTSSTISTLGVGTQVFLFPITQAGATSTIGSCLSGGAVNFSTTVVGASGLSYTITATGQ